MGELATPFPFLKRRERVEPIREILSSEGRFTLPGSMRKNPRFCLIANYSGSLTPTFVPAWLVGLTVKLAFAYALLIRFPSVSSQPLNASDTL